MARIETYCGDCARVMADFDECSIDMTITSPPYGTLRSYNGFDFDFEAIARQLYRVTKDGGIVVWITADQTRNGSESGESFRQALLFMETGFRLHDTMIWRKQTNTDTGSIKVRYGNVFEYMFVLSKGKPKGVACVETGRDFVGIDISEEYVRMAEERILATSGEA